MKYNPRLLILSSLYFIFLVFISLQIFSKNNSLLNFSYFIIPDSVTNYELTEQYIVGELELSDFRGSAGVQLYYAIFFNAGVIGFIIANIMLLSVGARLFGLAALYLPLIFYPHYLQLIILPSKDMMVLAAYFFTFYLLFRKHFLAAFLISVLSYFIRDGAMFVLLPVVIVAVLIYKIKIQPIFIIIAAFISGAVVFNLVTQYGAESSIFALTRNAASLQNISSEQFKNIPLEYAYVSRIFFNLTNMAFRLSYFDSNGMFSVASLFFYICGISSLVCCGISIRNIYKSDNSDILFASTSYLLSLFIISLNPFVQGRYQLPIAVVCSVIFFRTFSVFEIFKFYLVAITISFVGRFVYIIMNIPFPELEADTVDLLTLVGI